MSVKDTAQAGFITMIVDRLQTLEHRCDVLQKQNDSCQKKIVELTDEIDHRYPSIFLTPHSKYTEFNDGYGLSYEILSEPKMIDNRSQKEDIDDNDFVPLDDEHWKAVVLPDAVWLQVGDIREIYNKRIKIGRHGEPLTLRTFITELHRLLLEPNRDGETLADDIKYTNATGLADLGEPFYGIYEGLAPSGTSGYVNDMVLLLAY